MQTIKFSIIIPFSNVAKFLSRSIKSAINQSYENIEIILVDDASTDNSIDIAKAFASQEKRIKILQNSQNLGPFDSRKNGALNASGDYLLFLDADDYLHKDTCLQCYEVIENANSGGGVIDFILFNLLKQIGDGTYRVHKEVNTNDIIDDFTFEAMYFGVNSSWFNLATKCVRKDIFIQAMQLLDIQQKIIMAEDILASVAILGASKNIALLDSTLYCYCYNDNSTTNIKDSHKMQEKIQTLHFVISKLQELENKKDEPYRIFVRGVWKMLDLHIIYNETLHLRETFQSRIKRGYPRFIARLMLSLSKKRCNFKKREAKWHNFVREYIDYFHNISKNTIPPPTNNQ